MRAADAQRWCHAPRSRCLVGPLHAPRRIRGRMEDSVTVWAQPELIPLLRTADGIDCLVPLHDGDCPVPRDLDIEVMELAYAAYHVKRQADWRWMADRAMT